MESPFVARVRIPAQKDLACLSEPRDINGWVYDAYSGSMIGAADQGLQQIHGHRIHPPSRTIQLPDRERLARRYDDFRQAG